MDVETTQATVRSIQTNVKSDGLLLYVAQAIYEPGTSPLSSWVPIAGPDQEKDEVGESGLDMPVDQAESASRSPLDVFERLVVLMSVAENSLDMICRLIKRRATTQTGKASEISMQM